MAARDESPSRLPPGFEVAEPISGEKQLTRRVSFTLHSELQRKFKAISGALRTSQAGARQAERAAWAVPTQWRCALCTARRWAYRALLRLAFSGDGEHINLEQFQAALKGRMSAEQARLPDVERAVPLSTRSHAHGS